MCVLVMVLFTCDIRCQLPTHTPYKYLLFYMMKYNIIWWNILPYFFFKISPNVAWRVFNKFTSFGFITIYFLNLQCVIRIILVVRHDRLCKPFTPSCKSQIFTITIVITLKPFEIAYFSNINHTKHFSVRG